MVDSQYVTTQLKSQYNYLDNIFDRLIQLLDFYIAKHGKVLVVRFDIRYPQSYPSVLSNDHIQTCIKNVRQLYKRIGYDPYYMWTREQKTSLHPHYHCVLLLNGNKVQSFSHVFEHAERFWANAIGDLTTGLIDHCMANPWMSGYQNGIMLIRASPNVQVTYDSVVVQLSYLAKMADKRDYGDPWRNFGMSELH